MSHEAIMKGQIKKVRKISLWKYPSKLDKCAAFTICGGTNTEIGLLPTYIHEIANFEAFHRNISLSANFLFSKGEYAVPSINNRKDKFLFWCILVDNLPISSIKKD